MNFDITSFHDFSTGTYDYAFKVTGQTNQHMTISVKKSNDFSFSLDGNIGVGYSTKEGLKGDPPSSQAGSGKARRSIPSRTTSASTRVEWTKSNFELLPTKGVEKTVKLLSEETGRRHPPRAEAP